MFSLVDPRRDLRINQSMSTENEGDALKRVPATLQGPGGQILARGLLYFDTRKSAGRCIAFELGTSAGIHSYRALEAVALDYVNKRELKPPKHDLWTYLDMLEKDGADKNAIQVCQQLRKLRRNPVTHPEDNLDLDQGIEAFQLSTSAITALVLDMEKRQLFPNPQQH